MDFNKIKSLIKERKFTVVEICKAAKFSRDTYYKIVNEERITVEQLEKLSEILNVPITYFFNLSEKADISTGESTSKIIDLQDKLIKAYERIAELEAIVHARDGPEKHTEK